MYINIIAIIITVYIHTLGTITNELAVQDHDIMKLVHHIEYINDIQYIKCIDSITGINIYILYIQYIYI